MEEVIFHGRFSSFALETEGLLAKGQAGVALIQLD